MIILVLLDNAESGSMRSSELADCANVSRATMTGLLDTLEKADLLTRAPDPHDRRASNVKITPKGEKLLRKVQPLQTRWAQNLLAPLSRGERDELVNLLRKAQQAFLSQAASSNGASL
jgi:DNA-binding MarR family transcriptional regulator